MTTQLDGPATSLVTGGTKGIGRAIAEGFSSPGRTVVLNYLGDDAAAEEAKASVESRGGRVLLAKGDVSDGNFRDELSTFLAEELGQVGQFVHCAVRPDTADFEDLDPLAFIESTITNGASLTLMTHAMRNLLTEGSSVLFLSSVGAKLTVPGYMAIGAPKAMGESSVRYLAVALAGRGIRVNTLSCASLLTDAFKTAVPNAERRHAAMAQRNPSGRNIDFEDVVDAARYLCSSGARMVTGQELCVDGGLYSQLS